MTRIKLYNLLLVVGLCVLLAGEGWYGYQVRQLAKERQEIKDDYSFCNSVTFGLFSIDAWRDKISGVINDQINGYNITPEQKNQIREAVEKELHSIVAKTVREIDKPQKSIGGKLKKLAFNALVDSASLQKQVPPFAQTIVQKVSSPSSQARLKGVAFSKVNHVINQTYDATSEANDTVTKYIDQKYHVTSPAAFEQTINKRLTAIHTLTLKYMCFMFGCVLAALLLWVVMRKQVHLQAILFAMALLFAGVLLIVGLTSPIIELDARIQSLDFTMLGEHVTFSNQVLFFQSKSIWGIITTLISQQKPDAITVGILIMLFILILPFLRLIAKGVHMFVKNNKAVNYVAFEAGKWDMTDVMIVGIIMTYIGLNGILKSQLSNLNIHSDVLTTKTVNFTSLQPAFLIFLAYVLLEWLLSYILLRISPEHVKPRRKYLRKIRGQENSKADTTRQ
jgi:hypothetical protein